ncbi:L7Ae/L30e/S12e/Gadd45 family ribosomal protein [Desulfofundulus thermocisternus]|uniref:L7Ae/L30e/S12e/Gadd45 family ribosomal protein n=1 Tax=Desulfofundulus thermocisternus TaxID=42471 RepID=UPI00048653CD|nr:ribosomal L7Ae/L30e/S12e/Gadd45 family protein [Desulfofundulus thermocisternus]MBE3585264.1 ribosomal L7Ae/L30e/S12e/Gadd45 family protein [Thermoanaerobacter sp.]MCS5695179.1 ribosomal L7Ae/L30e/S12e/Gadd45 family protein [Desulfofundulus thermocisternus]MDK2888790.1 large subunit ribosomal protein [Thermoanaerobacter sp.]
MPLARLSNARKKMVGSKQTMKAINRGQAKVVYVAKNAERHVIDPIIQACHAKNIPLVEVETMSQLGRACHIEVGCASAAVIED